MNCFDASPTLDGAPFAASAAQDDEMCTFLAVDAAAVAVTSTSAGVVASARAGIAAALAASDDDSGVADAFKERGTLNPPRRDLRILQCA